jgi:O-Antigen ligase
LDSTAVTRRGAVVSARAVQRGSAVVVGLAPACLAFANGGYFSSSWGWIALVFAWLAAIGLAGAPPALGRGVVIVGVLALFSAWSLVSALWAPAVVDSFDSAERSLVVLLGTLAFLVLIRRSQLEATFVATVLGIFAVCVYALATRLFPDHAGAPDVVAGYRLARPIGYWNGLGIYAAIGLAIALGMAGVTKRTVRLAFALPIPILATTLYFTYSRGATIALAVGLLATFAVSPTRLVWLLRAGAVALPAIVGVAVATQSPALTTAGARVDAIADDGHRLALLLAALSCLSVALALVPADRFRVSQGVERVVTWLVGGACLVAIVAGLAAVGGPTGLWDKFSAAPPATHGELNQRLFSFSGSYRTPLWRQALDEYEAHPLLGGGAGSYEGYYLEHRTRPDKVRNAHNLYLETLAELGPIGALLLFGALVYPFVFVWRMRAQSVIPALSGAYVAFLLHLSVDWDWQLTAVAVTGLYCGVAILVASRGQDERQPMSRVARRVLFGTASAAVLVSFVVVVGNLSLSQAASAAQTADWEGSARDAQRAHTWAPWSSEPYRLLGEAQLGQGNAKAAAATFRRAIDKSPRDWNLWFDLARTTLGATQRDALVHAAKLNPLSPEIRELRSELAQEKQITVGAPAS